MGTERASMSIRSKLMLGLLGFSTVPLLLLGWFLCAQVNKARKSAVAHLQMAEQGSIAEMRDLKREVARFRAEEVAGEIARFLRSSPGTQPAELMKVDSVRKAVEQRVTVGCSTTVELLLNDRPVGLPDSGPRLGQEPPTVSKSAPFKIEPAVMTSSQPLPDRRRPYTYVAAVPGSGLLKVAATVEDMGVGRTLDRVARSIRGIGERTARETNRVMEDLKLMLVIGVTALVVGLTLVGGEVARTITKPICKLTAAAEKIRRGERSVDLDVRGGKEIQLLAAAFKQATSELQAHTESLETQNVELDVARRIAEKANHELQEAQDEMLQMEKMSSLGRLVAGVAHEINTPTGAIYNVTADAASSLDSVVGGLHELRGMPPDEYERFRHFLDIAVARRLIPERVSRKEKQELRKELEEAGIGQAKKYAELLAKCHITASSESTELCTLLEKYGVVGVFAALVEIHASVKISRTSAEKISQIVRALSYYSRSGDRVATAPTDVDQTIRDALIILHNRLKTRAEVRLDLATDLPKVRCTEGVTEVWVNLLTNACDAIEEKGEGTHGEIRIKSFCSDDAVHVLVADNGKPVPPEIVSKIFDPFFTTKPPGKGTGLGLSVVMGTVKRNGGTITLRTKDGFKEFEVKLPWERAANVERN